MSTKSTKTTKIESNKFNPYEILNVKKDATNDEIEKEYKTLAKKYHPDKNKSPDATKMFQNISKAKDILTNPNKRRQYDNYGITDENDAIDFATNRVYSSDCKGCKPKQKKQLL